MLALVVAIELSHAWQRLDVPNVADDWIRNHRLVARHAQQYDVLCLGDSAIKFGVAPTVIEKKSGRSCYNLAVLAGNPVTSYCLLRQALDAGARPSTIVIESLPHVLELDPRERSQKRWPRLLEFSDAIELSFRLGEPGLIGPYAIDRLLLTSRERETLRTGITTALSGESWSRRGFFAVHERNWNVNHGAMILQNLNNVGDPEIVYRENFSQPWSAHPINAFYTTKLLDLAQSRGIRVVWLLPPMDPEVQALCDLRGQNARFEQFVRRSVASRENVVVIDARRSPFERTQFVDWAHLNGKGALILSDALADVLGQPLEGPRWFPLPLASRVSQELVLEDMDQSQIAITERRAVHR